MHVFRTFLINDGKKEETKKGRKRTEKVKQSQQREFGNRKRRKESIAREK